MKLYAASRHPYSSTVPFLQDSLEVSGALTGYTVESQQAVLVWREHYLHYNSLQKCRKSGRTSAKYVHSHYGGGQIMKMDGRVIMGELGALRFSWARIWS